MVMLPWLMSSRMPSGSGALICTGMVLLTWETICFFRWSALKFTKMSELGSIAFCFPAFVRRNNVVNKKACWLLARSQSGRDRKLQTYSKKAKDHIPRPAARRQHCT